MSDSKSFTTNPAYGASASSNSISTPSSNTIPGPAAFDSAAKPPELTNDELRHLSAFFASLAVDPKIDLSRAASLLTLTEDAARYALNNVLKRFTPDLSVYDIPAPRPRPRAPYATRSNKRTRSENDKAAEDDSPPIPAKRARGHPHAASSSTAASKTAPARRRSSSKGSTIRVKRPGKDN
ncbi:hypothetical protein GTA08_BOTSDO07268 [Botryosphaeria dothidea]|uniref:Uncharacterized protein n=1 Tax=Botryosphaeria dothidea TaxID=55169 RepID=A0A8H4IGJ2_9PEZI|nr:hypothetical protein GTA08_BOTSDO11459 [Botryosphaeria dothidea]KAF4305340.1 hypothetical protein GTA08_BOTSDO07268 [Botryosphaeria dothidea]